MNGIFNDKNSVLKAYNDYIEFEFNERRNTKLDTKLGLLYTTCEEDGEEMELYYDTDLQEFIGIKNDVIILEQKADYDLATDIINCNGFEDFYNVLIDGGELGWY